MPGENHSYSNKENTKHSFWYYIYELHLYTSKGEALFKAIALAVSWGGGVWKQDTAAAYYLFSIAIIMEYAVQLIRANRFMPKVLPMILIVSNALVLAFSTGQVIQQETEVFPFQFYVEIVTIALVGLDALITLLIEPPDECRIETKLSTCGPTYVGKNREINTKINL
ncbi:MAG: hypothetical protein NC489_36830 [Ruminococcus flavefaciens]|nr:hypothetical protein [Ruminococcus flavefaciens]